MKKGDRESLPTVPSYMRSLGRVGLHVMLRYDPHRGGERPFTLLINGVRICDAGDPLKALEDYLEGKI